MAALNRKRNTLLVMLVAAGVAAIALLGVVTALNGDDDTAPPSTPSDKGPDGDEPVTGDPGHPGRTPLAYDILHQARLDLADRLGVDAAEIQLTEVTPAGWDGCLGIRKADQACTEQLIGGAIVMFNVDDEPYRYHVGGSDFVATDFVDGEVDDGIALENELEPNLHAWLAAYVRADLALRLEAGPETVAVELILPYTFDDRCLGFERDGDFACDDAITPGAVVLLGHGGETYRYHVSPHGLVPVSFEDGETFELDSPLVAVQAAMREELASTTGAGLSEVSLVSYADVQWPDGCLGVYVEDAACSQAIVDGFVAVLAVAGEEEGYLYHGAGEAFTNISTLDPDNVEIGHPLPRGEVE